MRALSLDLTSVAWRWLSAPFPREDVDHLGDFGQCPLPHRLAFRRQNGSCPALAAGRLWGFPGGSDQGAGHAAGSAPDTRQGRAGD